MTTSNKLVLKKNSVLVIIMLILTFVSIPKNRKKSLNDSGNLWAIAPSSVVGKIVDNIIPENHKVPPRVVAMGSPGTK
jgi:hypothetical protein